jgi:hypothetical protein
VKRGPARHAWPRWAERVTREIADRAQPLTFVRAAATAPTMSTR